MLDLHQLIIIIIINHQELHELTLCCVTRPNPASKAEIKGKEAAQSLDTTQIDSIAFLGICGYNQICIDPWAGQ